MSECEVKPFVYRLLVYKCNDGNSRITKMSLVELITKGNVLYRDKQGSERMLHGTSLKKSTKHDVQNLRRGMCFTEELSGVIDAESHQKAVTESDIPLTKGYHLRSQEGKQIYISSGESHR